MGEEPSGTDPVDERGTARRPWVPWAAVGAAAALVIAGGTAVAIAQGGPSGAGAATPGAPSRSSTSPSAAASPSASPSGEGADSTPTASCARDVGFVWNDPNVFADLPSYSGFVEKTAISTESPYGWGQLGQLSQTNVGGPFTIVRSPSATEPALTHRLLEMPSAVQLWSIDLPPNQSGGYMSVNAPREFADRDILLFQEAGPSGVTITTRSVRDGRELSVLTLGADSYIAGELDDWGLARFVAQRDLLLYGSGGKVVAVDPEHLDAPVWERSGEWVFTAGEVAFIDGSAYDLVTGSPLGWFATPAGIEDPGVAQIGGLLFRTAAGGVLTPVSPRTGEPCGPAHDGWGMSVADGYVIVTPEREALTFDTAGAPTGSLGTIPGDAQPTVVAGRFTTVAPDGTHTVYGDGDPVSIPVGASQVVGSDSQRVFTQSPNTGPVNAYDLDSGALVWTTESVMVVQNWGGAMILQQTSPTSWPILVAE